MYLISPPLITSEDCAGIRFKGNCYLPLHALIVNRGLLDKRMGRELVSLEDQMQAHDGVASARSEFINDNRFSKWHENSSVRSRSRRALVRTVRNSAMGTITAPRDFFNVRFFEELAITFGHRHSLALWPLLLPPNTLHF